MLSDLDRSDSGSTMLLRSLFLILAAEILGYALRLHGGGLSVVWPSAGVCIAVLATAPRSQRLGYASLVWLIDQAITLFVATVLDDALVDGARFVFPVLNLGTTMLGVELLDRLRIVPIDFRRFWSYAVFASVVATIAPLPASVLAAVHLKVADGAPFFRSASEWWISDLLGILVALPVALACLRRDTELVRRSVSGLERSLVLGLVALLSLVSLDQIIPVAGLDHLELAHIAIPTLVMVAMRWGWPSVSFFSLAFAVGMVIEVNAGLGPFARPNDPAWTEFLGLQIFFGALFAPSMLLAAYCEGLRERGRSLQRELELRRKSEARRSELRKQIYHSKQNQVVTGFAAGIAHDMNNLIQLLRGSVENIRIRDAAHPELRPMDQALERGAELMRTLGQVGRSETSTREEARLDDLVAEVLDQAKHLHPNTSIEHVGLKAPGAKVFVDRSIFRRSLLNLIGNALDASREQGVKPKVEVKTHRENSGERKIALVEIHDNGPGVPLADRERIFEPYFTTKGLRGTGLGLSIVSQFALTHGGTTCCRTSPLGGSLFRIELPELGHDFDSAGELLSVGEGETIALVDAEPLRRARLESMFRQLGYQSVTMARQSRLEELLEDGEFSDLIVIARNQDQENLNDLTRRIRENGIETPLLCEKSELPAGPPDSPECRGVFRTSLDDAQLRPTSFSKLLRKILSPSDADASA